MEGFIRWIHSFNKPLLLNDQSYACTLTHIHITSSDYICPIIRGFFGCTHRLSSCNCCRNVFGLKVKDHWPKPRVLDTLPILASILGYVHLLRSPELSQEPLPRFSWSDIATNGADETCLRNPLRLLPLPIHKCGRLLYN